MRGDLTTSPWHVPPEPASSRVLILSGLPGAGKDSWLRKNRPDLPVVSLDMIREETGTAPTANQGAVLQEAFELARSHLREKRDFCWNATCLSGLTRRKIVGLCRSYDAQVTIASQDVPVRVAMGRNRGRISPVPDRALLRLAGRREPVSSEEAHHLLSVDAQGEETPLFGGVLIAADPEPQI